MLLNCFQNIPRFLAHRFVRKSNRLDRRRQAGRSIAIEALEVRALLAATLTSEVLGGTAGTEIVGTVYEDLDANGAKSPGENGVSGWTVYLDLDNSGTFNNDAAGQAEPSAVTNPDGDYVINHLIEGTYRVSEVVQNGWSPTAPVSQDISVRNEHTSKADFFNFGGGEILGTVWNDLDGRGTRDTDPTTGEFTDPGLANWTVYLDLNGDTVQDPSEPATLTDAQGAYSFRNLPAGDYEVTEVLPEGWEPTRHFDSRQTATVVALQQAAQDFANFSSVNGSIQGTIWNDLNIDGLRAIDPDTGKFTEPGLVGWTVFLDQNGNSTQDPSEPATLTNADGEYSFISLPAGDYEVTEVLPSHWNPSPEFEIRQTVSVIAGEATTAQDFANFTVLNGSIRGTVWNDRFRDGVRDVSLTGEFSDPGLENWQVFLDLNRNGLVDPAEPLALTDLNGGYTFADLQVGDYELQEIVPSGWEVTEGYSDNQTVTVFSGVESVASDFANFNLSTAVPGVVGGTVWDDRNGNGIRDVDASGAFTDPGLAGRVVFADLNFNGVLDTPDLSATTGADGAYSITGILPGTVSLIDVVPAGWRATAPLGGARTIALKNGENALGLDFGNYALQESAIRGTVFADTNQSGGRNAGEQGLAGITVYLDVNHNGSLDPTDPQMVTSTDLFFTPAVDEAGTYSFTHLAAGTYTVRVIVPASLGATPAAELVHVVTLGSAEERSGVDTAAQFRPNEIHGVKFDDSNGNHQRDPAEPGVGGVTIFIDLNRNNALDSGEPTTVTLDDGSYTFGNLAPGAYVIREVLASGYQPTYPTTTGGILWPAGVSNPALGNVTPTSITTSLAKGEVYHETVSITLPNSGQLTNMVDVFLLFDDTGSFVNNSPIVRAAFPDIITKLQASLLGIDLGFGVGRFEEYANFAYEYSTGRPFVLNQPIVAASTTGYMTAIQAALDRTTPGYGGDQPETDIEALYQLVTGTGFDGNNNGSVLDSGAAGLASTQLNPGGSGDVPSFASFLADPAHSVMAAAGNVGGGGFRAGALPIILTATDTGFAFQPKGETTITGVGGVTLPVSALSETSRPTTPFDSGAGIQQTVTALNALGALVIGLGTNPQANLDPRQGLESLSKLTGAVNHSTATIDNGTADPIAPGDPLYFQISSGFSASVANGVVSAIQNAVTNVAVNITVQASDPRVKIINHSGVRNGVGSGQTATFDLEFVGDGVPHRFDLQFVRAGTNVILGSIPVVLGTPVPGDGYEFEDLPEGEIHSGVDFGSHFSTAATPAITVSAGTFTYDAAAHAATATATDGSGTAVSGSFSFTYNGSTTVPIDAGVYDVVAHFSSSDVNFSDATGNATLTINQATPTVTVTAGTVSYDGAAHAATAAATGVQDAVVDGTFSYTYNGSATAPIDVGIYEVVANFTSTDANYSDAIGTAMLTIVQTDQTAPTSSVAPLPTYSTSTSFLVSWSGSDNAGGSGLASYTIYVSDNGGAYAAWLNNTILTSALYAGADGHTYAFYSVATDVAGNTEAAPGAADATTTVDATAPTSSVNALPAYTTATSFNVSWSGSDNAGGSGLASYTIYVSDNGGTYTALLTGTTSTSTTFNATVGHTYRFYSTPADVAGNVEAVPGSPDATTTIVAPLTVTAVGPVSPDPRNTAVSSVDVTFSAAITGGSFSSADVTLTRNAGANLISGAQTISFVGGTTYRINNLIGLTGTDGAYLLTVDATTVSDSHSLAGQGTGSDSWLMDTVRPTSTIQALPPRSSSTSLDIVVLGNDPAAGNGSPPSGVSFFDIFVSIDSGPYSLWRSGPFSDGNTQTYLAECKHTYDFRSVVRDAAGNIEVKGGSTSDTRTYVPDLLAPETQVRNVDRTSSTLLVSLQGRDQGGGRLVAFDLYVSVDEAVPEKRERIAAGAPNGSGIVLATTQFQALADGSSHSYRFYTVGIDDVGNTESAPAAPADVSFSQSFAAQPQRVTSIDVQRGEVQRSRVQYLDAVFTRQDQLAVLLDSIQDGDASNDRLFIKRFELDGTGSGALVSLTGKVAASGNQLGFDFGSGGMPDGYYEFALDFDGNGSIDQALHFYRLQGDFNGDRRVDAKDMSLLFAAFGKTGPGLLWDLNGDGKVDQTDRTLLSGLFGRRLGTGLPVDD
ncbi:MAG: SdrD B-like domain-containing protein [Planctomycetales bacterium]